MVSEFGNGNVDLLTRPLIDSAKLIEKGWTEAGEGVATLFSSQFGILNQEGEKVEILVTPILPNGDVLSPSELEDYVYNELEGVPNILQADKKGILISLGVSEDGKAGENLHLAQEKYYKEDIALFQRSQNVKTSCHCRKICPAGRRALAQRVRCFFDRRRTQATRYSKDVRRIPQAGGIAT